MDNRYYFKKENLKDDIVTIDGQENIHLTKVRRASLGENIKAFCLDGFDYELKIDKINKAETKCSIERKILNEAREKPNIKVYLASIKQDAIKEALDNLTQLNAKEIIIFESDYTQARYSEDKLDKLKINLIQSAKQCERADIPNIRVMKFKDMLKDLENNSLNVFAYENAKDNFSLIDLKNEPDKDIGIIVGGEGGFSVTEVDMLDKLAKRTSMGKTILRAPVAVSCLFASIASKLGYWGR